MTKILDCLATGCTQCIQKKKASVPEPRNQFQSVHTLKKLSDSSHNQMDKHHS